MKEAKFIRRGFAPCFFAISAALVLNAVIWGAAISFALSYVIAPWQSHILMLFNSVVCSFIPVSLFNVIEGFFSGTASNFFVGAEAIVATSVAVVALVVLITGAAFAVIAIAGTATVNHKSVCFHLSSPYALTLRQVG